MNLACRHSSHGPTLTGSSGTTSRGCPTFDFPPRPVCRYAETERSVVPRVGHITSLQEIGQISQAKCGADYRSSTEHDQCPQAKYAIRYRSVGRHHSPPLVITVRVQPSFPTLSAFSTFPFVSWPNMRSGPIGLVVESSVPSRPRWMAFVLWPISVQRPAAATVWATVVVELIVAPACWTWFNVMVHGNAPSHSPSPSLA
jgi:hypothetical protein